eukprot:gnl/MRDRNA2_/MRDRNA2_99927_c0_seq1.p1 gnl/MRDRNA2_/MRDRNA2_99927_c0~~gnl/MRDRNA2_/MRDRNA2_99927_c0_seq1.p1  ORF type:complete len:288 (+),score=42.09 gnl/MRDRNA2_/MRDRNA2_99927_c0_seq1:63-926(+)
MGGVCSCTPHLSLHGVISDHLQDAVLGFDSTIGNVVLHLSSMEAVIHDIVVHNPPGYHSAYLIRIDRCVAKLSTKGLLAVLRGKHLEVNKLSLHGVYVVFEKVPFGPSNAAKAQHLLEQSVVSMLPQLQVIVHKFICKEVVVRLTSGLKLDPGVRVEIGDLHTHELEVGKPLHPSEATKLVMKSIIKTVLGNVLGHKCSEKIDAAVHKTRVAAAQTIQGALRPGTKTTKKKGADEKAPINQEPFRNLVELEAGKPETISRKHPGVKDFEIEEAVGRSLPGRFGIVCC